MPLVVTPFHPGDIEQAFRQAQWIRELGRLSGHDLLLIADTRCSKEQVEALHLEYAASYDHVEVLDFVDHYRKWPESPNQVFGLAARHIMRAKPQPWLFLEPDAVPLKTGWLDGLWAEYQAAGKPFMGDFVSAATAGINIVDHMSGNAIWPADLFTHAGLTLIADVAFDVAGASQIVPQMHKTKLIQHQWKAPPFESWQQVEERIRPEAVVYHASKDGSLIRLLREHKNLPVPALAESDSGARNPALVDLKAVGPQHDETQDSATAGAVNESCGGQLICDIFIKTYPPDWPWFTYCHTSCLKFATGFRRIYVVAGAPNHEGMQLRKPIGVGPDWIETPTDIDFTMGYGMVEPSVDGYLIQQVVKLHADKYTDADYILFTDSDTIFTQPVTPETYFTHGLINWMITPYAKTDTPWQPMIEKFLGIPVEFETMRRHPQMVPRWLLIDMREFCEKQHGVPLDKYVMSQPYREFSEFNALGAFAYYFHHDKFNWINTEEVAADQLPPLTVLQKYSHDGLTPQIEAEFEAILGPSSEFVTPAPNGTAETLTQARLESVRAALDIADQTPWADKKSSLAEIQRLSARLKEFCTGAGRTRQVRDVLRENGVIK